MQTSSREFAKKNGQMDSHLATDETHFHRSHGDPECTDGVRMRRHRASEVPEEAWNCRGMMRSRCPRRIAAAAGGSAKNPPREIPVGQRKKTRSHGSRPDLRWMRETVVRGRIDDGKKRKAPRPHRSVDRGAIWRKMGRCGSYFLCRARFKSFRCLCFRIFLRRFLITLPTGNLPAPRSRTELVSRSLLAAHTAPGRANESRRGLGRGDL